MNGNDDLINAVPPRSTEERHCISLGATRPKNGRRLMPGLTELIWPSAFVVQSIHVVARLGLADILGPEPRTIDELAKATRVHAPSLKRVLRALTTVGVFAEDAEGRLRHTALSETLRTDHPESVRARALM